MQIGVRNVQSQIVMQRILVAFEHSQLHAFVLPKTLKDFQRVWRKLLLGLDRRVPVEPFAIGFVVMVFKCYVKVFHFSENALEGINKIVEYGHTPCLALLFVETFSIDDSHLLEHCRFSALPST
jgi:hypothetical protein